MTLLLFDNILVQLSAGLLFEILCVREGFLDLLGAYNADVIAGDLVNSVDSASAVELPEDIRSERVVRNRVASLVLQDHLVDMIIDLHFALVELGFELR